MGAEHASKLKKTIAEVLFAEAKTIAEVLFAEARISKLTRTGVCPQALSR